MNDLEFMKSPEEWPRWPILPVKRSYDDNPNTGFLVEDVGKIKFFVGNIWAGLDKAVETPYESLEALVDEGWVVD